MPGKFGADFNSAQPSDDDLVKNGAGWIRDIKARLKTTWAVLFNLETGELKDDVIGYAKLTDLSPDPAGTFTQVTVNAKGLVTAGTSVASTAVPVGAVIFWPADVTPDGYFECDGRSLSRTDYSDLFDVLDETWGSNDSSTFKIPDFRSRFLYGKGGSKDIADTGGAETVTLSTAEMPSHSHSISPDDMEDSGGGDVSGTTVYGGTVGTGAASGTLTIGSTGGGQAHDNMPPYSVGKWIIKHST